MSDRYRGTIEFPVSALKDAEIRQAAEEEGVTFDGDEPGAQYDDEVQVNDGIFLYTAPEIRNGMFDDLERVLKMKGIPFDRVSEGYYEYPAEQVIYRPAMNGTPEQDATFPLLEDEPVVNVAAIRELLNNDGAPASAIQAYLDEHFPAYPPLTDWVKEG